MNLELGPDVVQVEETEVTALPVHANVGGTGNVQEQQQEQ